MLRPSTRRALFSAAAALSPLPLGVRPLAAAPPPTAYLPGDPYVETYRQKWALSCELAATHTALRILGHNVSEDTMRPLLGGGEDPDQTFRGEIQANQTLVDYGVHARGIARLIDLLAANGHVAKNIGARLLYDLDSVRTAIAASQPVIAWLPLGLRASTRVPTRLSNGKIVNLVPAEHTVTVRGYDGQFFYALDPHRGTTPRYETAALWRGMSLFDDPALAIGAREHVLRLTESPQDAESTPEPEAEPNGEPETEPPAEPSQSRPALNPISDHRPI